MVAAVVVTCNRKPMLEQCIGHLLGQSAQCDILVVDNASTDGTDEWLMALTAEQPRIKTHRLPANTGGAGGFNYGMRWAVEAGYEFVWIMDDDSLPEPDALEKLLEAGERLGGQRQYGFLSSAVLWTDGRGCQMNRQKVTKEYYQYAQYLKNGIVQIEQATFVSLLFPAAVIRRFGLPIKEYFIWGDDIEYTRRIAKRGKLPCFLVGQSQVVHAMASNSGSNIAVDELERLDRYRYAFRNECCTFRKEGLKGVLFYLARCARSFWWILTSARGHRVKRMGTLLHGMVQGLLFWPKEEHIL